MGHSPDKACESFFGFNSVLPGAYSLYRWDAIKGKPLREFFKGNRKDDHSCAEANKFLAEDRVMCLEILIKKGKKYYLTYIPDAKAFTDAPDNVAQLISQRRRWMNGAVFGTLNVVANLPAMLSCNETAHGFIFKFGLFIFFLYFIA